MFGKVKEDAATGVAHGGWGHGHGYGIAGLQGLFGGIKAHHASNAGKHADSTHIAHADVTKTQAEPKFLIL